MSQVERASHSGWTTVSSETLLSNQWLRVRELSCRLPDGSEIADYYVVDFPRAVTVVPLTRGGDVLLVRQYKHALGAEITEFPSGHVDRGETDAIAGARELLEETGYDSSDWLQLPTLVSRPARSAGETGLYLARDCTQRDLPVVSPSEHTEVLVVSVSELDQLVASGVLVSENTLAAYALARPHI